MVSIPDWSKFSRMGQPPPEISSRTKYQNQREIEAIKEAEEHGYFFTPTKSFLVEKFIDKKETKEENRKPSRIKMVRLPGVHMRSLGDISQCTRIRVLSLNSNYISRFDELTACKELVKLDLHGNQISMVPGVAFWSCLRKLKILHLHDNPLGRIEVLHHLAGCASLQVLTLYDTPLSIKKNYRHHVVNSIWSLKALDRHVISDEEIIEDAVFANKFASLHPGFKINLWRPLPEDATYEQEKKSIIRLLVDINNILSHYSPVLIAQKVIRGFLTRKRYKIIQDTRIWAAVVIQRFYRKWKGLPTSHTSVLPPPPSTSPAYERPGSQHESVNLEYDEYLKHRRPGSTGVPSEVGVTPRVQPQQVEQKPEVPPSPKPDSAGSKKKKKNLFINLSKLESSTLQNLQDEVVAVENMMSREGTNIGLQRSDTQLKKKRIREKKTSEEKPKKIVKSVKQFFGPVVSNMSTPEPVQCEFDEELPITAFRLRGIRPKIHEVDPMAEVILANKEAGRDVRSGEAKLHRQLMLRPRPEVKKQERMNKDRLYFARMQGTMGLSCLRAVQQAYKDRERAEKMASKMEYILNMREEREQAKERVKLFNAEKRSHAIKHREEDHMRMIEVMERRESQHLNYIDETHKRRNKTSEYSKTRAQERTFVSDFNTQHTSVSNALLRHDRHAKREDTIVEKTDLVQNLKEVETEKQELVKKYLEHRKLMRQTETSLARGALDTKMLQETNDRIMQARARVAQLKARTKKVQAFYPLPTVSNSLPHGAGSPAQPVESGLESLDRWETQIKMFEGHIGRHHVMVRDTAKVTQSV